MYTVYASEAFVDTTSTTMQSLEGKSNKKDSLVQSFLKPVDLTRCGLGCFFKQRYNHEQYATDFLPCSFVHVDDFLSRMKNVDNPAVYVCTVLSLFEQKLKESLWVNPYACAELLSILKKNIPALVAMNNNRYRNDIKSVIHDALLVDFDLLKKNPESFIDALTSKIIQQEKSSRRTDISENVAKLVEGACDKLVWNPHEDIETWESCKQLGNAIYALKNDDCIIGEDRLNQVIWSLVVRYTHFIKTVGMYLPLDTIDTIVRECSDDATAPQWLLIAERERLITDKRHMLLNALQSIRVQAMAHTNGMWVE
jgi:hypothetical protein